MEKSLRDRVCISRQIKKFSDKHGIKQTCISFNLTKDQVKNHRRKIIAKARQLGNEYLEKLRRNAKNHAIRMGYFNHADDFASYCVVNAMETGSMIKLKTALPSYLKQESKNPIGNYTFQDVDQNGEQSEFVSVPQTQLMNRSVIRIANQLNVSRIERAIFILIYEYGFSDMEIAETFRTPVKEVECLRVNFFDKVQSYVEENKLV